MGNCFFVCLTSVASLVKVKSSYFDNLAISARCIVYSYAGYIMDCTMDHVLTGNPIALDTLSLGRKGVGQITPLSPNNKIHPIKVASPILRGYKTKLAIFVAIGCIFSPHSQ